MGAQFDAIVVGAGPSGSSAARDLAERGARVALLEKARLPRYKTCGGGLTYRTVRELRLPPSDVVEHESHAIELNFLASGLSFRVQRNRPVISMTMRDR